MVLIKRLFLFYFSLKNIEQILYHFNLKEKIPLFFFYKQAKQKDFDLFPNKDFLPFYDFWQSDYLSLCGIKLKGRCK